MVIDLLSVACWAASDNEDRDEGGGGVRAIVLGLGDRNWSGVFSLVPMIPLKVMNLTCYAPAQIWNVKPIFKFEKAF